MASVKIDLTDVVDPCNPDDHTWEYDSGDPSVGMNAGWVCADCGATHDGPPPEDDYEPDWP